MRAWPVPHCLFPAALNGTTDATPHSTPTVFQTCPYTAHIPPWIFAAWQCLAPSNPLWTNSASGLLAFNHVTLLIFSLTWPFCYIDWGGLLLHHAYSHVISCDQPYSLAVSRIVFKSQGITLLQYLLQSMITVRFNCFWMQNV
jgi:hypothetical protein